MSHLLGKVLFRSGCYKQFWKNFKQYQIGIEITRIHHQLVLLNFSLFWQLVIWGHNILLLTIEVVYNYVQCHQILTEKLK